MPVRLHVKGTKTAAEETGVQLAKTINAAIVYIERPIRRSIGKSRNPATTRLKRRAQLQRLLNRI
jgi:hypothetical protein